MTAAGFLLLWTITAFMLGLLIGRFLKRRLG